MIKRVKSLKKFFTKNLIENEVKKWNFEDCSGYLDKHNEDFKKIKGEKIDLVVKQFEKSIKSMADITQTLDYLDYFAENRCSLWKKLDQKYKLNRMLNEKINKIVEQIECVVVNYSLKKLEELFQSAEPGTPTRRIYYNEIEKRKKSSAPPLIELSTRKMSAQLSKLFSLDNCSNEHWRIVIPQLIKNLSPYERRQVFKNQPFDKITNLLVDLAPDECKDEYFKGKGYTVKNFKNIGVFLWAMGYNPIRPLGEGSFGSVWECGQLPKTKAIKVIPYAETAEFEKVSALIVKNILAKLQGKNKKYFSYLTLSKYSSHLLKSALADNDLCVKYDKKTNTSSEKHLDGLLRKARQACKALILLHDAGYSHNDVKEGNFLQVKIPAKLGREPHKHRIKLADFGLISRIPTKENKNWLSEVESKDDFLNFFSGTSDYMPKDICKNGSYNAYITKDVYALGVTLLRLLTRNPHMKSSELKRYFDTRILENFRTRYLRKYIDSPAKMSEFLKLLVEMTSEDSTKRITLENTLLRLKEISKI